MTLALAASLLAWFQRGSDTSAIRPTRADAAVSASGRPAPTVEVRRSARARLPWTTPSRAGARRADPAGAVPDGLPASYDVIGSPVARAESASLVRAGKAIEERARLRAAARKARIEARKAAEKAAEEAARRKAERRAAREARTAPFTVRIATFNVLGSQHSARGGSHPGHPPASVRTPRAAGYISRHGSDIVGTQELQADQLRQLTAITGMAAYPGFGWGDKETDNSILYDAGVFEYVSGDVYHVTFVGRTRPQPILRLRHRETGRELYVLNTHTSPGDGAAQGERHRAHATTSALVRELRASSGLPVLLTGDMNDRPEFFCRVVATAGMTTPQGGSYGAGCRPPAGHLAVDWVAGAGVSSWSDYWMDQSSVANKTSDHFYVSGVAHIGE